MCDTCGCNVTHGNAHLAEKKNAQGLSAVDVLTDLLSANDRQAAHNRRHFDAHGVLAINLMSAPGAGKTQLLEASIDALKHEFKIAVIEGTSRPRTTPRASAPGACRRTRSSPAPLVTSMPTWCTTRCTI